MTKEKEWFEPGTKEFLIREILSLLPVGPADATDAVIKKITELMEKGIELYTHHFTSEVRAASEKQGRPFSTKILDGIIRDVVLKQPSDTQH